ncbi:efflux transporter periplasmic adaptor subunit [Acinetobacter proteolyticus]|jgi:multidrug efflux system membrane fusion protein|uniref:Efflux transporter periplasmic adaptor subunit n=1 Tax=Acinetobacter proteolyticus TaxID=1776741 RepID=A0A653K9Q0_9GAMM|nr:efflux RND transporter periplasmic adaptor subunit [Acinetobacter proteolyticus]OEY92936.1 efflux transporter periplasmic adaptor subunit [Acinetobacter proteolyticus]VXA57488.1 Efflux transporter periplasmic adaptor subunit [Acinetobacter proteolyticus]
MSISRKQLTLSAVIVAIFATGGSFILFQEKADAKATPTASSPPAATVDVASVVSQTITDWQEYSGRLEAIDQVDVRPQVSGKLIAVHFKDGSLVNKGDLLFTIDPRPFEAELNRAKAQLASAEAQVTYSSANLGRNQRLIQSNAIAHQELDQAQNEARSANANLQAAKAAVETARLNLEYTRITAPVSGRISRAEVTVGNVVSAGNGAQVLTSLVSVSRLYASFDVDEQTYLKYISNQRNSAQVPVYLGLANESGFSREGFISSIDNNLNTTSGTIRVRATFDNPKGVMLPGLYARIRLGGGQPRAAILISPTAIGVDQDKRFVVVVDAKNQTAYREVKLGAQQDGLQIINSGLQVGDRIVVNGLQRIRPGDPVSPHLVAMPNPQIIADNTAQQPQPTEKTPTSAKG